MKKLLCVILTAILMCSMTVVSAYSVDDNEKFDTYISALRENINTIFNENYSEIVEIVRMLEGGSNASREDYELPYFENCGPFSVAFQKVLYDNGIVVEVHKTSPGGYHDYNVMRTNYNGEIRLIVIDTTYKQFLTSVYTTNNAIDYQHMEEDLPDVLVYEYGNMNMLDDQLSVMTEKYDCESAVEYLHYNHYFYKYLSQDMQRLNYKTQMNYSNEFMDALRNYSGEYNVKMTDIPMLESSDKSVKKVLEYDKNGVYRCYLTNEEFLNCANGFIIVNQNGELLFGAETENTFVATQNVGVRSVDEVVYLSAEGSYPIRIKTNNVFLGVMLSIDLRTGESTPVVSLFSTYKSLLYGDVNRDSVVNVNDVTYLQKSIVGLNESEFSNDCQDVADVMKCGALNVKNATAISQYIAELRDFDCGTMLYYSSQLNLGAKTGDGYIDM